MVVVDGVIPFAIPDQKSTILVEKKTINILWLILNSTRNEHFLMSGIFQVLCNQTHAK